MEPFDTIDWIRCKNEWVADDVESLRALTQAYPSVPELWDVLGDVMQACDSEYPIDESLKCYREALACDHTYAPAYESIGWALDTYFDDFQNASRHFMLAIENGAGDTAHIGLARVLAQCGRTEDAIDQLQKCDDQHRQK